MDLETLPNEITTHIFTTLPTISSVLALASTNHHFNTIYHGSQRLAILSAAADAEYGPLNDIIQICTYNASQPAHIPRTVPMSDALIKEVLRIGRVAKQWEDVYPFKKWKDDYAARRLLSDGERYALRRALYRLWHYTKAFHNRQHPRTTLAERAALLHNYPTVELAEMYDVQLVLRDVVANNICPSNGRIRQKFQKRYPDSSHQLLFNIHLNYPAPASTWCSTAADNAWLNPTMLQYSKHHHHQPQSTPSNGFHNRLLPSRHHEPGAEGWGDDINHYYVVEDMMKLDPGQILLLKEKYFLKGHVEAFVRLEVDGGEGWFVDNGETFSETLWSVLRQRHMDDVDGGVEGLKREVEDGVLGVACGR
ncbi:hypothetical protein LTR86_002801 [Recurvomyces mirabilis]|nr:hypothetical protein LTR86_002801 [Recurvomyces mirabilis]